MNLLLHLILDFVPMVILFAVAASIYHRKGMRGKKWYRLMGVSIAVLLLVALCSFSVGGTLFSVLLPVVFGLLAVGSAIWWRPPTVKGEVTDR
ncbi:hypothetical protein EPA93_07900 [Ktedonosporobacter rubrisoli]|uniref:Uncharacterized protein n=1 Tax=Ktedonosporobacter rubrisoli TaxID=2509675 RepID=A0A4P6JL79_KTERU|nr:hypothetical protein [Ktedonosporobacter rubrisoli]QBD75935.1 hypothetical protein EPA93_07900 [Ktedonosporobacter rubrisoli]